jgi:hypothetical protein
MSALLTRKHASVNAVFRPEGGNCVVSHRTAPGHQRTGTEKIGVHSTRPVFLYFSAARGQLSGCALHINRCNNLDATGVGVRQLQRRPTAVRMPLSKSIGEGGQPGTVTSTGMTFAIAPATA